MRFFVPLSKVEDGDDDTLIVTGIASTENPDRAGETLTAKAIKDALPDFFAHGTGALREMHGLSAAGTVDEATINDENQTLISTTVVDTEAMKKVRKGVYKGFSVGGRVLERDKKNRKIITKIVLTEISLVDRPANPEAVFDLYKADGSLNTEKADPMNPKDLDALTKAELEAIVAKPDPGEAGAALAAQAQDILTKGEAAAAATIAALAAKASASPADALEAVPAATTPDEAPVAKADAPAAIVAPVPAEAPAAPVAEPLTKAEAALAQMEALGAVVVVGDLSKGLYAVGRFAEVLESIAYLAMSGQHESEAEGDSSPVPAALRGWLKEGAKIFKDMAKEEIDELVAAVSVKKAEAAEALTKGEDMLMATNIALIAERDTLAKAVLEKDDLLAKIGERLDPLSKAYADMAARLAVIEDTPLPSKTAGPLAKTDALPVSKEQDAGGAGGLAQASGAPTNDQLVKALSEMTDDDRTMILTKAALTQPRPISFR